MIIDTHIHLYPPETNAAPAAWAAARGEALWSALSTRKRKDGRAVQAFPSVDELLRAMDAAGVDRAVLLGWYWERHATGMEQNRFFETCVAAHPSRLRAFATVHPGAGDAALEEVRWAKEHGFLGLGELSPHSQRIALGDPVWRSVLSLAGKLHLPVNLHVTDPESKPYPGRVDTPLCDFVGVAREFPATKFILSHWGGGLAFDSENRVLRNVYYDTSASPLLYSPEIWSKAPVERTLFGSDYPLILYPRLGADAEIGRLIAEAREGGAPEEIFAANAQALLGWA